MKNFDRNLKSALKSLWRNKFLSLATIAIMSLILFIFNVILTLNSLSTGIIRDIYEQVDIIVYLQDDADIFKINTLVEELSAISEVLDVKYTTKEEALQEYMDIYPQQGNPFEVFGIENPLPANIQITTETPEIHDEINNILDKYENIILTMENNGENQNLIDKVIAIGTYTQNLILVIMLIFIVTSFLIILNTMYMTVWTRKDEIEIMELVGANLSTIRIPFLIEGFIISMTATLLSLFLIGTFISSLALPIEIGPLAIVIITEIIISVAVGLLSSSVAIEHHLRHANS